MNIEKQLIGMAQTPLIESRYIIAHESGNPNNVWANSLANELNYMKRNWENAFVSHWVGGGGRIVQIARTGLVQWGAGPRANPYSYAQVELARTNDRPTFEKDYAAFIWLLRHLADEAGLPKSLNGSGKGIKTHRWVSENLGGTNHVDPDGYLKSWGVSMVQFKKDLEKSLHKLHLVVRGDTLWSLSRRYNTSVAVLKSLNGLKSDRIIIGQILKVG
ncbi:LysM peptidoglycan-binding domain-containing protein [Jeotgalibaca sp. A127]|uniref:LysM peptidoglycan-binding domain-containing protein n=1 Tax=Jeotgalibaca sp. A127 TaxID=3457324 RepID=UPI003FD3560C